MISLILYGRNDNYGYNLHKRAALSLNCMAELLTDADDEILFVDYNTADDFPTFPEAIHDTLTAKARALLRILRVRPAQHARFAEVTHLVALEPIARNVALRRSNPANRWVLSTNTDMIFVPRQGRTLSDVAAGLADGFYHLPRFEIPESLWESLDRADPCRVIAEVGRWGWELHLNEIVYGAPDNIFDAPGDFQLALRADLWAIDGFDERMLLGWHVDSNLARRLSLWRGPVSDALLAEFFGYHCDHTRQVTPAHRHGRVENDSRSFVDEVAEPKLPAQRTRWGLAEEAVEEVRPGPDGEPGHGRGGSVGYLQALRHVIGAPLAAPTELRYVSRTFDRVECDPAHVLPYLVDSLASLPPATRLGWFASGPELLMRFAPAWQALGHHQPLLCAGETWPGPPPPGCTLLPAALLAQQADAFVFDFSRPVLDDRPEVGDAAMLALRPVVAGFRLMVAAERTRLRGQPDARRRFVAVNAIHNRFETLVTSHVGAVHAPISTRLRQGFVLLSPPEGRPFLKRLQAGEAGSRDADGAIRIRPGVAGCVFYGGYVDLIPGAYRLSLRLGAAERHDLDGPRDDPGLRLEVVVRSITLAMRPVTPAELAEGGLVIDFAVSAEVAAGMLSLAIEARLWTEGRTPLAIVAATLTEIGEGEDGGTAGSIEWLPAMSIGGAGRRQPAGQGAVAAVPGQKGHIVYGPYVSLWPGAYELTVELAFGGAGSRPGNEITVEVITAGADAPLARSALASPGWAQSIAHRLAFAVEKADDVDALAKLEFRVHTEGKAPLAIRSVRTQPLA